MTTTNYSNATFMWVARKENKRKRERERKPDRIAENKTPEEKNNGTDK